MTDTTKSGERLPVDVVAQMIRVHSRSMGAGQLAEAIVAALAPQPGDGTAAIPEWIKHPRPAPDYPPVLLGAASPIDTRSDRASGDVEGLSKDRADWLLDAIAGASQDRRFLRGDPAYDEVVGEIILLNGKKAIRVAIERHSAALNPGASK